MMTKNEDIYKKFFFKNFLKNKIVLLIFILVAIITYFYSSEKNIINEVHSLNGKHSAISKLEYGKINIYKKSFFYKKKINNNDKYKKILSVDNQGNILYVAVSSNPHYAARSNIFFNEKKLKVNPGVHTSALSYEDLFVWKFFHYHHLEDSFRIYFYNSKLQKVNYKLLGNKFPEKIFFLDKQNLYLQTFDGVKSESFILNLSSFDLRPTQKYDYINNYQKKKLIINLNNKIMMTEEQHQIINYINEEFINNDPSGELSKLDNFEGRLSWYVSKKLEALINIQQLYKKNYIELNKSFDLEFIINIYIKNILKSYEKFNHNSGWPTKKYSKDKKTKLYLSISNSTIFYPLFLSMNSGLITDKKTKRKILDFFEIFFQNHEQNFLPKMDVYKINNNDYNYTGIEPLNFQSQFGLCLIEAYKATKDKKYLDRLILIAKSLKTQINLLDDGSLIWSYAYLDNANLSSDLENFIGEDLSHASTNINFFLESSILLGENFYFDDLIDKLNKTIEKNMDITELKFNRHLNEKNHTSKNYKYLPKSYWLKLNNEKLNYIHIKNLIVKDNYFNNSRLLTFSIMLKNTFK